jgi:hypothetical protein
MRNEFILSFRNFAIAKYPESASYKVKMYQSDLRISHAAADIRKGYSGGSATNIPARSPRRSYGPGSGPG